MTHPDWCPKEVWEKAESEALKYVEWLTPKPDEYGQAEHVLAVSFARAILSAQEEQKERDARIAERDADWTAFARQPKKDWKTGAETNSFAPMDDPGETFPTPVAVFAYANGIAAGAVIAAAIRRGEP